MKRKLDSAKKIAALGIMAALIIAGKWSLVVIPNVEVVTLFCGLFGYVFGFIAIIPATIFCIEETFAWGVHTWVLVYFVHWNAVVALFALLGKLRRKPPKAIDYVLPVVCAVVITVLFGVFSTFVDAVYACVYSSFDKFFIYFGTIYARGIVFFIVQTVCNLVLFSTVFHPLAKLLFAINDKVFPPNEPMTKEP